MKEILPNIFARKLKSSDNRWKINGNKLCVWRREQLSDKDVVQIDLPPGSYEILFTTNNCTEQQAATIVEKDRGGFAGHIEGFKDYDLTGMDMAPCATAALSLESLLIRRGLDPSKNYLLLKKIS